MPLRESTSDEIIGAAIGIGAGIFLGFLGTAVLESITPPYCPNCKHIVEKNIPICPNCGMSFTWEE